MVIYAMIDSFTVAMQTLVLILLAKMFVNTPIKLVGSIAAIFKTFSCFMPILLVMSSLTTTWTNDLITLTILSFELSVIAVLVVSTVKMVLLRLRAEGMDD